MSCVALAHSLHRARGNYRTVVETHHIKGRSIRLLDGDEENENRTPQVKKGLCISSCLSIGDEQETLGWVLLPSDLRNRGGDVTGLSWPISSLPYCPLDLVQEPPSSKYSSLHQCRTDTHRLGGCRHKRDQLVSLASEAPSLSLRCCQTITRQPRLPRQGEGCAFWTA